MANDQAKEITLSQVLNALSEVIELHDRTPGDHCSECYIPWPCRTVEILKRNFEKEDEESGQTTD